MASATLATTPNEMLFAHPWYYLDGKKFWHQDVTQIADLRRKGVGDGQLVGAELEAFVKRCLRSDDYSFMGFPSAVPADAVPALN